MTETWFTNLPTDLTESVRIDREPPSTGDRDHRTEAIESYHLTPASQQFLQAFLDRLRDETTDMHTGSSYWLYGYYGSGKSHLLTVLDGLLDTQWLTGRYDTVWDSLVDGASTADLDAVGDSLECLHTDAHLIAVSVNLQASSGENQRGLSERILRDAHQNPALTGVDDGISTGLSSQLDVAYFEDWYRTTALWSKRQQRANAIIETETPASPTAEWDESDLWANIQQYSVLSAVVLPKLFEDVTGTTDGYSDLQPSNIDPETAVSRLESLRQARQEQLDESVTLVVLLDAVDLFVRTDFERLTELQTLAEAVDDIGGGDIQLVATAQTPVENTQPKIPTEEADCSIVTDRFPHRYQLPSSHVGTVATHRLFEKSQTGTDAVEQILDDAELQPTESLVYREIKQHTTPPLDSIDETTLIDCYPFVPYHVPLFAEILHSIRHEATDPTESIVSGTARSTLAVAHELLEAWIADGQKTRLVSLVDLFEVVTPELRELRTEEMRVIEGTEETAGIVDAVANEHSESTEFDLDVAKAILLLQCIHDIVPLNEGNIAVAVMSDLHGESWISTTTRVEKSLDRLQKFIRPTRNESSPRYRFASSEERRIYEAAKANEASPEWDAVVEMVDEHLWERIIQELPLAESVPYDDSGDEYPVSYHFEVDGTSFETGVESADGLDVSTAIQGVRPDREPDQRDAETLYWEIATEGLDDLRKRVVEWWALRDAIDSQDAPPAVERDLEARANAASNRLTSALTDGSYAVKDRTEIGSLSQAVQTAVDVAHPADFHPLLLQVDERRLSDLRDLDVEEPLPTWARTIQVPGRAQRSHAGKQTIQRNVLALTGRQLQGRDEGLSISRVLDGIVEQKPFYDETRPALRAILWGLCRNGRLVATDEAGTIRADETVLSLDSDSTVRLKLLPRKPLGKLLEAGGFKETTDTVADGLTALQAANNQIRSRLTGVQQDVCLVAETDVRSHEVTALLEAFADALSERIAAADDRHSSITAQAEGIDATIDETTETDRWLNMVHEEWTRRRSSLLRLDAVLTIGNSQFGWLDETIQSAVESRSKAASSFDGVWWTPAGWSSFSERLGPDLATELCQSWTAFVEEHGLTDLVDRIDAHPWVIPSAELPAGVHTAFERRYVSPLDQLREWYETIDTAVETVAGEADADELSAIPSAVARIEPLDDAAVDDPAELRRRLTELSSIVGDRTPKEVDQIGVLPADRRTLDRRLQQRVASGDVEIEQTDHGVIVR